jgi:hypothetical protein
LLRAKEEVESVYTDEKIKDIIIKIVHSTRPHSELFMKKYEGSGWISNVKNKWKNIFSDPEFLELRADILTGQSKSWKGTKEFWKAYEEDVHQEERKEMNAEGPVEMSDRFAHFTNVLGRYAHLFY